MRSLTVRHLVAALAVLAVIPGTGRAQCPEGGTLPATFVLDPQKCKAGAVSNMNMPVFVSTRSGFQNGGFKVVLRDALDNPAPAGVEVWLAADGGLHAYLEQLGCQETVCAHHGYPECAPGCSQTCPDNLYTYVEGVTNAAGEAIFSQRWGGYAGLNDLFVQVPKAFHCSASPPNQPVEYAELLFNIVRKSTDMNADGKWNACDRAMFALCQGQTSQACLDQADFDLNGHVDAADLAILEADFDGACTVNLTTCLESDTGQSPACGTTVTYPSAVCDLASDVVGPNQIGVQWTAPASGTTSLSWYQLRYATFPITSANFTSATSAGFVGATAPPGSPQSQLISNLTACQTYYFAIKAVNTGRLIAPISNVHSQQTVCKAGGSVASPAQLDLVVADGRAIREQARLSYAVPPGDRGDGGLAIFNAAGRRVRTLVSGAIEPGVHEVVWDLRSDRGESISAGVYFARLSVGHQAVSRPLVVVPK